MKKFQFKMIRDNKVIGYMKFVKSTWENLNPPESYINLKYALVSEDCPEEDLFWKPWGKPIQQMDRMGKWDGVRKRTEEAF